MRSPIPLSYLAAAFIRDGRIKFELYIDSGDAARNRRTLSRLMASRSAIEARFGSALDWIEPSDQHRYASLTAYGVGDIAEERRHPEYAEWFTETGERLKAALEAAGPLEA
jgi:hypothetical protein